MNRQTFDGGGDRRTQSLCRRSRRYRAVSSARGDDGAESHGQVPADFCDPGAYRMFPAVELDTQRHHHPRDFAAAEHDVAAGERHQDIHRLCFALGRLPYLPLPGVGDPVHHRQGEFLLAREKVIERTPGVSRFACDLFQDEIAVPVSRKPPRRRFE